MLVLGASLPAAPIVLLAFVVLGTCTFVALGYAVASVIPSSDAAPAIVNAVYLGLILVTVLMTRLEVLPDWIRETGGLLPLGPLVSGLQHAWIDGAKASDWLGALVLLCWGAAAATWTVRRFRWEPAFER